MKKAALYIRVSTHFQIDRDSLPFQRQELINYSKYVLGIDDYEVFEDAGYSAKNTDRPAYQSMMTRIRAGEFSHIVVWKIDRISRNLKDFTEMYEEIKKYNITFISKNEQFDTSSAMGEAMLKIILVFAELERKLTGERVYSIMLSRAEKGLWNGATVPLGYKWCDETKFPVIDDDEAAVVKYIYNLYEKNHSTQKTAYQLNLENIKTKRDGKWTAKTIGDVLRNPFYIGTYRYNVKSSKRRWKDKKEWVVVENNHPGIIDVKQFEKVNQILSNNYRGDSQYQRANINTHAFSGIIYCGKCGSRCSAGLDVARKDGYRPSRYTCYSSQYNENHCNNFISDITLLPFILNYIANFIRLQNSITQKHSLRDIEKILLRGKSFVDVIGIDRKGLEDTYTAFILGFESKEYSRPDDTQDPSPLNFELENLKKEKVKYEKALERLENLFLFSEEAMAEKDFLFKKRDIVQNIERINDSLNELYEKNTNAQLATDLSFLQKAGYFLVSQELSGKQHIDYRKLLDTVGIELIKDFIQTVIEKIVVNDKKVSSITFKNGIVHHFAYKEKTKQKIRTREKLLYLSYEPQLMEYLNEHKFATRKDVENLTGMSRSGAHSIIQEFLDRGIIEKKGNSIAVKYFLKEDKAT